MFTNNLRVPYTLGTIQHTVIITFFGILFFLPTWGPPFHPEWWLPVHN